MKTSEDSTCFYKTTSSAKKKKGLLRGMASLESSNLLVISEM
jgi:hypothetical protein